MAVLEPRLTGWARIPSLAGNLAYFGRLAIGAVERPAALKTVALFSDDARACGYEAGAIYGQAVAAFVHHRGEPDLAARWRMVCRSLEAVLEVDAARRCEARGEDGLRPDREGQQ